MSNIVTSLFYGLFVTTSSLYIASEAFKKVQGPLLAIHLILLRQSSMTLQSDIHDDNTYTAVAILPSEIWNMIKIELIKLELEESEIGLLNRYVCDHCKGRCGGEEECFHSIAELTTVSTRSMRWKDFPANDRCEICMDIFYNSYPWRGDLDSLHNLQPLLSFYHLELIPKNVDGDDDLHPLSAIGLKTVQQECNAYENYTPFHAITGFSASTFDLPFSVDFISRQLQALQKDYRVELGDHKIKTAESQVVLETKKQIQKEKKLQSEEAGKPS